MNKGLPDMNDCDDSNGDCTKAAELVNKYIDGILEDADRVFIRRHLDGCPGCKHGYDFEASFHIRVKSLKPVCMPEEVKSHIMLALGFPGMSSPTPGSMAVMDSPDVSVPGDISAQMGIPRGEIPQGQIPTNEFFSTSDEFSSSRDDQED
jgi:hypothetical protein